MIQKEQVIKKNEAIVEAIKIAQMLETDGGKIFQSWIEAETNFHRYPDVMGIIDLKVLYESQGMVTALDNIKQYFIKQNLLAQQPMVDEKTGQPEILNKK